MTVLSVEHLRAAVRTLQHAAQYDSLRLQIYREKENLGSRIQIARIGAATLLRFEDVGYFNRVYCPDETVLEILPEIEEFYRGSPFGCELVGPPGEWTISRPGWRPVHGYAWLYADDPEGLEVPQAAGYRIRPPGPTERDLFLHTYLRAFGAESHRIPGALRNMRHLLDRPELDCMLAWYGEQVAGVGMMMRSGTAAVFCAGATVPEFRENGCHKALLAERVRLAVEHHCDSVCTWAVLGGQSQANIERAGLALVAATTAWRLSPERP